MRMGPLYAAITFLILGFCLLGLIVLVQHNQNQKSLIIVQSRKEVKKRYRWLKTYHYVSQFLGAGYMLKQIRRRLSVVEQSSETDLRVKSIQMFTGLFGIELVVFLLFAVWVQRVLLIMIVGVFLLLLTEVGVDFWVVKLRSKLLEQQIHFNEILRHKYYETKMIDEAFYEACAELDEQENAMRIQGEKIHDTLTAKDMEQALFEYQESAPNRYLKLLASLAFMTKEYGDSMKDGQSVFMKNLSYLSNELRIEVMKRERLNYAIKSLNFIILIPLFVLGPIRNFGSEKFMPLKQFYDGPRGFLLEMITIVVVFISFYLLKKIQQLDEPLASPVSHKRNHQNKNGLHELSHYIARRMPMNKKRDLQQLLKEAMSSWSLQRCIQRQLQMMLIAVFLSIVTIMIYHQVGKHAVLYGPTLPQGFMGGQLLDEDLKAALEISSLDAAVIKSYRKEPTPQSEENPLMDSRVLEKIKEYERYRWSYLKIGIIVLFGFIGYLAPTIGLRLQVKLHQQEIDNEVNGFMSIILMLMHHERLSTEDIIEWMEMFSIYLSEPLQECLNRFTAGEMEALEALEARVGHKDLRQIVERLKLSSMELSLQQAFDELESEKQYFFEKRKESNERSVHKRIHLGQTVGFIPVYALIILYIIIPMLVSSIQEMDYFFQQI